MNGARAARRERAKRAICAQLLQQEYRDPLDAQAQSNIAFAVNGAHRMEALLKDRLFYSRVSSASENSETVDAKAILRVALLNPESAIRESAALIEVSDLPMVAIPEAHLIQLFQNLIGNAIKYRGPAVPHIQVRGIGLDPCARGLSKETAGVSGSNWSGEKAQNSFLL